MLRGHVCDLIYLNLRDKLETVGEKKFIGNIIESGRHVVSRLLLKPFEHL